MKESQFQAMVIRHLREEGCYVLNMAGGTQIPKGTPDLLSCFPNGRFAALELKTDVGRTSELQEYHLSEIRKAGGYATVLRPKDWENFKTMLENMRFV